MNQAAGSFTFTRLGRSTDAFCALSLNTNVAVNEQDPTLLAGGADLQIHTNAT
jgi:hypothetical protein